MAKTKPILASSAASRMSIGSVMVMPTPTAGPLMAAITGFSDSKMRSVSRPPPSRGTPDVGSRVAPCASVSKVAPPPDRSAPAQKPRPAPVTITARTSSSASVLVERVDHLVHHPAGERVELVGPVQRDRGDVVGDVVGDLLVLHGEMSSANAAIAARTSSTALRTSASMLTGSVLLLPKQPHPVPVSNRRSEERGEPGQQRRARRCRRSAARRSRSTASATST